MQWMDFILTLVVSMNGGVLYDTSSIVYVFIVSKTVSQKLN